jgi:CubicO group peptidase (beta-lactamase class C family)
MKSPHSTDDILQRIWQVENGLCSGIAIEGRSPVKWKLADRLAHYRVPGVSISVINDGEIEWAKGYGTLEAGGNAPVTTETLFQAASISKPVAALASLHLVEGGLLELDEDVNAKLVSWQVSENEFVQEKKVTLRGLLSHYAGLTVHGFKGYPAGVERPTLLQVLDGAPPANSDPVRVNIEPGSKGRYSGGGYSVMQQLCIDVTGQPFADLLQETVLKPLGMIHSTFEQPLPAETFKLAAKAHGADGKAIQGGAHIYPELAAAGLWTTPSDLARFALGVQQAFAGESAQVISEKTAGQLLTYQWQESKPSMHPLMPPNMGLGLFLAQTSSALYFSHSGGNEGYRCQLIALRDQGQGAVVMTNSNLGMMLFPEILFSIAQEYGWPGFASVTWPLAKVDPTIYASYAGEYEVTSEAIIRITADRDRLIAQAETLGLIEMELYPASETEFFITELPHYQVSFVRDDQGQVVQMRFGEDSAKKVQ